MNDAAIIELFFSRDERAIAECRTKYGRYCRFIAMRILGIAEDAEEAESDAYMKAWSTIPPNRPESLNAYLGMLCRQSASDMLKKRKRAKRGGGEYALALEELSECVPAELSGPGCDEADRIALTDALNGFLASLPEDTRTMFMRRYWWMCSVREIAEESSLSESAVKMRLLRTREKLREFLKERGIDV